MRWFKYRFIYLYCYYIKWSSWSFFQLVRIYVSVSDLLRRHLHKSIKSDKISEKKEWISSLISDTLCVPALSKLAAAKYWTLCNSCSMSRQSWAVGKGSLGVLMPSHLPWTDSFEMFWDKSTTTKPAWLSNQLFVDCFQQPWWWDSLKCERKHIFGETCLSLATKAISEQTELVVQPSENIDNLAVGRKCSNSESRERVQIYCPPDDWFLCHETACCGNFRVLTDLILVVQPCGLCSCGFPLSLRCFLINPQSSELKTDPTRTWAARRLYGRLQFACTTVQRFLATERR